MVSHVDRLSGLPRRGMCFRVVLAVDVRLADRQELTDDFAKAVRQEMPNTKALDYRFESDGKQLVLQASLGTRWRKKEKDEKAKTYFFSEAVSAEWRGGQIRGRVAVFPRPGGLTDKWAEPPRLLAHGPRRNRTSLIRSISTSDGTTLRHLGADCCSVAITSDRVMIAVDLLGDDSESHPRLRFEKRYKNGDGVFERFFTEKVVGRIFSECQIQLRLVFHAPAKPPPTHWSFWNEFLPGGRPESNRDKF